MGDFIIMFLIIFVVMIALEVLGAYVAKKYVDNLLKMQVSDPEKLLKKLNGLVTKAFVPKYQRLLLKIEALTQLEKSDELDKLYDDFNESITTKKHAYNPSVRVMVLQKELSYYLYRQDIIKATKANGYLQDCKQYKLNEFYSSIIDECDVCLQVYGCHNYAYIDKGKEAIDESENKVVKGIWCYRLAYLYRSKDNEAVCNEYLDKALDYVKDSDLQRLIEAVKEDASMFDKVAI